MRTLVKSLVIVGFLSLVNANSALSAPLLQLDIAGGRYDESTKTIVASSNPFTLYALATPVGPADLRSVQRAVLHFSRGQSAGPPTGSAPRFIFGEWPDC
jgi:hypothetical protein